MGFSIDALEENLTMRLFALEADQGFVIGNGGLIGVSGAAEELFGALGHGTIDDAKTLGGHTRLLETLHRDNCPERNAFWILGVTVCATRGQLHSRNGPFGTEMHPIVM